MRRDPRKMQYPIEVNVEYPEKLSRLTTFFRAFMAIPQYIVLYFVSIAAGIVLIISWFAILFTGRYPKSLFNFMTYYFRWNVRFSGYLYLLTDKYPPFSGDPSTIAPPSGPAAPKP
jgi:hypothetical protein